MAVTWLAGSLLGALGARALGWVPGPAWVWWLVGVVGLGLCWLAPRAWPGAWLAALCWGVCLAPPSAGFEIEVPSGGLARLGFEVERGGCGGRGCFAEAVARRCEALEERACVPVGTRIGVASADELPAGAQLTALVRIRPRVQFINPGAAGWVDTRSCCLASVQRAAHARIDHVPWLAEAIAGARVRVRALLERTLRAPHAGVARALLLGEGSAVDPELNAAIRDAGVSHVLAVSGMHVTLLVGAWVVAIRRLWLFTPWALWWEARRVGAAAGVVLAPLLARLCGASPSAARAAWTSMLMYLLTALGLRPAALPVAALVVAGFAVVDPREALHPGFMLSVLATAALLSDPVRGSVRESAGPHEPLASRAPLADRGRAAWARLCASPVAAPVSAALRTSVRAWLATTPFLLLCFGQLALIPLVANVALLPLGEALVPLAAVHLLGADLLPTGPLFSLASGAFVQGARWCAALDPGLALPPPTPLETAAIAAVAMSGLVACSLRARVIVAALASLAIAGSELALRLPAEVLRVTFLDVGQGDSVLLESDGHAMLIDAGGAIGPGPDPGALAVLPALHARRIRALDRVVLTHPHPDHYGGLSAVLAALPVRELWDNGQGAAEDVQPVIELLARAAHVRGPAELCGTHRLGRAQVEVLAPCPGFDLTREPNDNSFVLRVTHGAHAFLLTGDVEREGEASLRARVGHAEVLKLGHHGSRTSSTPEFLAAVRPTLAIASAGRGNSFGHPHPEVVQRLGASLLRTDREGGIEVESDGRALRVRSARHPEWRDLSVGPAS